MVGIPRGQSLFVVVAVVVVMLSTSSRCGSAGEEGKRSGAIASGSQTTIAMRVAKKGEFLGESLLY